MKKRMKKRSDIVREGKDDESIDRFTCKQSVPLTFTSYSLILSGFYAIITCT